jgi:cyclic pyranopterin phosphate synthase
MPKEVFGRDYEFLNRSEILTYEEIARLTRAFVGLGVRKIRITGGEPLVRRDLPDLVAMLSRIPEVEDLTLTTNGVLLAERAKLLKDAGLGRVTVSLDAVDDATFKEINGAGVSVGTVLEGIGAAKDAGLTPVKVNAVVKRGLNEDAIVDLARHFRGSGVILRFIEYMDVGSTNKWRLDDVVPAREIIERIRSVMPLEPVEPAYRGEVARRWRYTDGGGEIGIIASVSMPFCGDCTRARLSPEGILYTCLFATTGHDLKALARGGSSEKELLKAIEGIWIRREDGWSEIRSAATWPGRKVEMSYIGG